MINFKISDGDPKQSVTFEVDSIAGTVGIEAKWDTRWISPSTLQSNEFVYACFKREDAIKLAHAILSAALEC